MYKYLKQNCLYFSAVFLGLLSFWSAIVYRLYSLNNIGIAIILALSAITSIILLYKLKNKKQNYSYALKYPKKENKIEEKKGYLFLPALFSYALFYSLAIYVLFIARTAQTLISPWQAVPSYFFIFYGLATIILLFLILYAGNKTKISLLLISLHYFLSFSVALLIYKIGYGFDPFIHQATADLIDKTGAVYPKPFYYLGQYGLIVIFHKITTLPLAWLDKLLVPVLAALLLPATVFRFSQKWFANRKINLLLPLIILILPFPFFIVTTPQNLAYLFLLLTLFCGLACSNLTELIIVYLLALASLTIHPLAGIPAIFFALALTVYHSDKTKLKKYLYFLIFCFSAVSLPLAFYFVNKNNPAAEIISESSPAAKFWSKIIIPGQENFILNFIYLYVFNLAVIIGLLILAGLIIAYRHRQACKIYALGAGLSASLAIAYILTSRLPFSFLISYERNDYLERILVLIVIFLLPFIIISLYGLGEKILEQKKTIKIPLIFFLALLITTSLYSSYPRFDRYWNSHGYSTGENDITAVHWIENDAGKDYIVLANQQVSAAALREFGFNRYYKGDIYFYPIPTGGQLYQYYLAMVYEKPSRVTMTTAMDFANVSQAYFVLNKYWWAFDKILAEAKLEADSWTEIKGGEIYIFKYKR